MSEETILEMLWWTALVLVGCEAILHEHQIAKMEKKAWKYIKCFFKALKISAKEFLKKGEDK